MKPTNYNYLIILVLFAAMLFGLISQCNKPKEPHPIDLRAYIIDSIQSAQIVVDIAKIDAEIDSLSIVADNYKANASIYRKLANRQKQISDSLQALVPLTDTTCLKTIASKQAEIDTLNVICDNLDIEAVTYSRKLFLFEDKFTIQNGLLEIEKRKNEKLASDINVATKKAKRNWFERNKLWIGAVGGAIWTAFILK